MWFKPLKLVDFVDGKNLIIAANTTSAKNQLTRNYFDKLSSAVKDIFGNDLLVFQIEANAFLWKMVRTLTGTLINLDKFDAPQYSMEKILFAKDRTKAGVTAPPTGLFLYKICFDGIRRHV